MQPIGRLVRLGVQGVRHAADGTQLPGEFREFGAVAQCGQGADRTSVTQHRTG